MEIPQSVADAIIDPAAYADGDRADDNFAWLRANAPLSKVQANNYGAFWAVVRHADLLEVERRGDVFVNSMRSPIAIDMPSERRVRELTGGSGSLVRTMLDMDSPEHMKYRRLTQSRFMPQSLRALEDKVRIMARGCIDRMAGYGGECDFARDIAFTFPLHVIMELMGVPEQDEALMLRLTQELFGNADPEMSRDGAAAGDFGDMDVLNTVVAEIMAYFAAITEDRRARPRDDLVSIIAGGKVDGEHLGPLEAGSYYFIVATAGHDTTSSSLAGSMWAAAAFPDVLEKLRADPALIGGFVDESIRWVTPVKHFMRTARVDTELAGQKIAAGDWLFLSYHSANRDEAAFDDPLAFDIERPGSKHVAFGYGAHNCLGQHLARMELRVFWEELLPRLKSVSLTAEPVRTHSNFVCGPKTVPIRFELY